MDRGVKMEVTISIRTSKGSIGFGWECDDILEDDFADHISEGIGDSFWENYYEFENIVEKAKRKCTILRKDFSGEKGYKKAVVEWMKVFFKSHLSPITVHYAIDDEPVSLNFGCDLEECFIYYISDVTAYNMWAKDK